MHFVRYLGVGWGILGVLGLLITAIYRLGVRAVAAYETGLSGGQWTLAAAFCVFMAYSEGYRGFQLRFSPRTAARIRYLRDDPDLLRALLAPLFAIGYFHATRRTKIAAYGLTAGIATLVLLIRFLDQPWRGLIDAGVVVGLAWGVVTLVGCIVRALSEKTYAVSPEVRQDVG